MKKLALVVLVLFFAGCEDGGQMVAFDKMPPGLEDCQLFYIVRKGAGIYVVRCPNSSTSTSWTTSNGKVSTRHSATLITD